MTNDPAVDIEKFLNRVRKQRESANATVEQIEFELVRLDGESAPVDLNVDWSQKTVWASQQQTADLFGVDRPVVTKHLANIFDSGYRDYLKQRAMEHAEREWNRVMKVIKSGEHLPVAALPAG